ncbi:MAG: large subunit ribosomal protein [Actinomycetota bacterium]|jgi:large subunit ribosomal protein L25|nr:large subunit ribosomal protein [Actinomycetota bacterium]
MPEIRIAAEKGRPTGSAAARRMRLEGKIPGVVYGHGTDPTPVAVDGRALRAALTTEAGFNALLELEFGGDSQLTLAREIQRHPVRHTVTHVDFVIVRRDEVISADVNITLVGEALEVHREDGVVAHELFSLTVQSTPALIPNSLEVDISALKIGDTIRVGDLKLPEGVTTEVDPEAAIVVGQPPQVSEADLVTEADAEAAEAAEGEAAAEGEGEGPEGGDAPAAEGGEGGGGEAPAESSSE